MRAVDISRARLYEVALPLREPFTISGQLTAHSSQLTALQVVLGWPLNIFGAVASGPLIQNLIGDRFTSC